MPWSPRVGCSVTPGLAIASPVFAPSSLKNGGGLHFRVLASPMELSSKHTHRAQSQTSPSTKQFAILLTNLHVGSFRSENCSIAHSALLLAHTRQRLDLSYQSKPLGLLEGT